MGKLDPGSGLLWVLCQMEQEAGETGAGDLKEGSAGALGTLWRQVSMEQHCQHWCPEELEDALGRWQS